MTVKNYINGVINNYNMDNKRIDNNFDDDYNLDVEIREEFSKNRSNTVRSTTKKNK